jgi:replicative DNA helicase
VIPAALSRMADVIMLLSQKEFDLVRQDKSELINVNIAKHRNGPTGIVKLLFEKRYSRFQDEQKE